MNNSRMRWAKLNRDKDVAKSPRTKSFNRKNPKRKSKPLGSKTRDKRDPDTADVVKDSDLKAD